MSRRLEPTCSHLKQTDLLTPEAVTQHHVLPLNII